ncbi:MAG: hypothetical protein FWF15_11760, partial [Oscillospiraceae bacterium]|nr:hypothetical protein [Oscillospiraceae bacterium]
EGGTYETKQQNILKFEKFLNKEDAEVSVLDIKGYRLIGFENTSGGYQITESQYERIVNALHTDRPTILCTHVPFYTETLTEDTVKYWKSNIVMGSPDFPPNESTQKLLDYLSTETNLVVAILTGHIHFNHEDYIFGTIPQYVTALSAEKNLRCITL